MNQRDDLDRMLHAWLDDPYAAAPRYLGEVLERTRHTRQRRARAASKGGFPWPSSPAPDGDRRCARPPARALLVVALAASGAIVVPRFCASTGPVPSAQPDEPPSPSSSQEGDIFTAERTARLRQLTADGDVTSAPLVAGRAPGWRAC